MNGITHCFNIRNADYLLCQDIKLLRLFLVRCVESVALTPVKSTIQLVQFPIINENKKPIGDFGVSGGLILLESHIYLHTWPEKEYIRLELSSCKIVDADKIKNVIMTFFGSDIIIDISSIKW